MKKNKSAIIAFALIIAAVLTPTAAFAQSNTQAERANIAGQILTDIMNLIMENYLWDISPEALYEAAVNGMTDALDSHSEYYSMNDLNDFDESLSGYIYDIGISVNINDSNHAVVSFVTEGSPAYKSGVMENDRITSVNSESVDGMDAAQIYMSFSGGKDGVLTIEAERNGEMLLFNIERTYIKVETVHVHDFKELIKDIKNDNSKIRYISIDLIGEETGEEIKEVINSLVADGVTGIVLDLRGNPGGYMDIAVDICRQLVPEGPIMFTIDSKGVRRVISSQLKKAPFDDIVVVTDNKTASAAEVITSALQDSGAAVVLGEQTYGKGVIQTLYPLPLGGGIKFTTDEYLRRSGYRLNNIGVTPDVMVEVPKLVWREIELDENNSSKDMPNVKKVLAFLGYPVGDGNELYDDKTKESVKKFQNSIGQESTGKLDGSTMYEMNLTAFDAYYIKDLPLKKAYEMLSEMTESE